MYYLLEWMKIWQTHIVWASTVWSLLIYVLIVLCIPASCHFFKWPKEGQFTHSEWVNKRWVTHTIIHNSSCSTVSLHSNDPTRRYSSGCLLPGTPTWPVNTQTYQSVTHTGLRKLLTYSILTKLKQKNIIYHNTFLHSNHIINQSLEFFCKLLWH